MAVVSALRRAVVALVANPILVLVTGAVGVLQVPQLAAQAVGPTVATAVSMVTSLGFIVIMPYLQGGLIAMADEALADRTSLQTFTRAGRANYVQLLIGYALLIGVNLILILAIGIVGLVAGIGLLVLAPDYQSVELGLALAGGLLLVFLLSYLTVAFFVQFYGQAIVLDDLEAMAGFRRSVAAVRSNLLATTGYSLVVGLVAGLFGLVIGILSLILSGGTAAGPGLVTLSLPGMVLVLVGIVAISMLVGSLLLTYSVGFYRTIRPVAG